MQVKFCRTQILGSPAQIPYQNLTLPHIQVGQPCKFSAMIAEMYWPRKPFLITFLRGLKLCDMMAFLTNIYYEAMTNASLD